MVSQLRETDVQIQYNSMGQWMQQKRQAGRFFQVRRAARLDEQPRWLALD